MAKCEARDQQEFDKGPVIKEFYPYAYNSRGIGLKRFWGYQ